MQLVQHRRLDKTPVQPQTNDQEASQEQQSEDVKKVVISSPDKPKIRQAGRVSADTGTPRNEARAKQLLIGDSNWPEPENERSEKVDIFNNHGYTFN